MITRDDVDQAARRTAGLIRRTPVMEADANNFPGKVWFKCEFMQHTGTFKARGAQNFIQAHREAGTLQGATGRPRGRRCASSSAEPTPTPATSCAPDSGSAM